MRADLVRTFETFLKREGVADVVPTYQLLRTASEWRSVDRDRCAAHPFEMPPRRLWRNIVPVLRFLRERVEPAIGQVEVVSAYRNERLNRCTGGRPESAHRGYYALDLVPQAAIARDRLIALVCALHRGHGVRHRIGLGFYAGTRFHLDAKRYRLWGADGRGATSPCLNGP